MQLYRNPNLFAILLMLLLTRAGFAQPEAWSHRELKWFTIETEHFFVHYHDNPYTAINDRKTAPQRTAQLVAQIAEEVYGPVTALYRYQPEKIHFIIRDTDDYSNGGAYFYDNKIEIWASSMDFELRGTHNWLRNVVTHEFTHMISIQTMMKYGRKIPAFYLQYIGYEKERRKDVLRGFPNRIASYPVAGTVLPVWFAEGTAQYQQRSLDYEFWDSHRDMILRDRILSGQMLTLNQMSTFGKNSIGNESSYNHGYAFISYLASLYGEQALSDISHNTSRFFYGFEKAFRKATGRDIDSVYTEWLQHITRQYQEQTHNLQANAVEGEILFGESTGNFMPVVAPDGKTIAFLSNKGFDYLSQTSLYLYDTETKSMTELIKKVDGPVAWSSDGSKLAYSKNLTNNKYHSQFNDVYLYDLKLKKEFRITRSLRATSPAFAPDGRSVCAVVNNDGTNNLVIISSIPDDLTKLSGSFSDTLFIRHGLTLRWLTNYSDGRQIYKPQYHPDGNKIIFDTSIDDGRDIYEMDLQSLAIKPLADTRFDERSPVYSPDGRFIYYTADPTGIFNIYRFEPATGRTEPVTNVTGGAFYPACHPEAGLIFTMYKNVGYKIARIKDLRSLSEEGMTYKIVNPNIATVGKETAGLAAVNDDASMYPRRWPVRPKSYDDTQSVPEQPYKPYRTTFLDFAFLPALRLDYNTVKPGFYFYSGDVLGKSSLFGGSFLNFTDFDRDIFAIFEYGGFGPTLFLELYNVTRSKTFSDNADPTNDDVPGGVKYESIQTNEFELREVDMGVDLSIVAPRDLRLNFSHNEYFVKISGKEFDIQSGTYQNLIKSGGIKYFYGNDVSAHWKFSNVPRMVDYEINPRGGRRISFRYSYNMDNLISGFAFNPSNGTIETLFEKGYHHRIENTWSEFLKMPLKDHTLQVDLQTGIIANKVDSFYNFFAGGLMGLKGYSFYSMEGSRLALLTTTYRFPLWRKIDRRLSALYLDKIFGGIYFGYGNAWSNKTSLGQLKHFKKDIGGEVRMEFYSFYIYPTRVTFDAVYGLDRFVSEGAQISVIDANDNVIKTTQKVKNGGQWRYYLTVLFGFTLFD